MTPSYSKEYYRVLGLEAAKSKVPAEEVRKAYRHALLSAHPDKAKKEGGGKLAGGNKGPQKEGYTIDDVKEAFAVLGDKEERGKYDRWLAVQPSERSGQSALTADFVLGLEVLDLADFEGVEEEGSMLWTRGCRCGDDEGFRITEEELEGAVGRGEKEVLVGCLGCSLWVRVGFEVEEG